MTPCPLVSEVVSKWRQPTDRPNKCVHQFTGDTPGKRQNVVPHFNKDLTPYSIFMLYFASVITLLLKETNRYYHQYLDTFYDGPSPLTDVTESEMFLFLAIIIQMGHDIWDSLADHWSTIKQFLTPFYSTTMKYDRFFHIIQFLHFSNNDSATDENDPNHDRLWKLRNASDSLNEAYSKYYTPSEHLAVDEIIVLFKGRLNLKQYSPRNTNVLE
jgi:hypothetical protein